MQDFILTQLTVEELRQIFREEFSLFLASKPTDISSNPSEEILSLEEARSYLKMARSTLYNLVNRKGIPSMKRGKKLYFSKQELRQWVEEGRKPTRAMLKAAAQAHVEQLKPKKQR
jgi:excisionase family DNA binding protein